jgi:hypothetical protein
MPIKKTAEDMVSDPIGYPVEPIEPTNSDIMIGLLRERVNVLIASVNDLAEEVAKLKKG